MKFNDTYFLNNFHKARFQDAARRNGQIYQDTRWLVTAYLFTSTPEMTQMTAGALTGGDIDFKAIEESRSLNAQETILVRFAANYFAPEKYSGPSVSELINGLSGEYYTVMVNVFKMFV